MSSIPNNFCNITAGLLEKHGSLTYYGGAYLRIPLLDCAEKAFFRNCSWSGGCTLSDMDVLNVLKKLQSGLWKWFSRNEEQQK
jgi:hypothetical protein